MSIEVDGGPLRVFSQDEFHELDYTVMGIVFQIHNQFGRFLDELLYKRELAARCLERGIPTEREVRILVRHDSFSKEFKIDLLFSRGVVYEAKAVERLAPAHESQTLNYLLLSATHHGKLINLRPERVESRFVSTSLTPESRKDIAIDDALWREVNGASRELRRRMLELLGDWGAFLDFNLYREALTRFFGGPEVVIQPVKVYSDDREIGEQQVHLVADDTAFAVTAVGAPADSMRLHLGRFLSNTRLQHIQWINLDGHRVEFATLSK